MKLSIVIPAYNTQDTIGRCLDSVLGQTYRDIEIIVVDDGSTDHTGEVLDRYARDHDNVTVMHSENRGCSEARNTCIARATGEYIFFVDSDDTVDKDAFELFVKHIESFGDKKPDVVNGCFNYVRSNGTKIITVDSLSEGKLYTCNEFLERVVPANQFRQETMIYIYRADFVRDNNITFTKGIYHEDLDWIYQILCHSPMISYFPVVFYNYIVRGGSIMTSGNKKKRKNDLLWILKNAHKNFNNLRDRQEFRLLMGLLIRQYIHECAEFKIPEKESNAVGISKYESLKYAVGKDKLKALIFLICRNCYYKLYDKKMHR